ncbi:MAG: GAF domain-containing SpoIIE family protein phosphatase [Streptosporangiaceae bacterium]
MPGADEQSGASFTVLLSHLVRALSQAESADEMARVVAEKGAVTAGAEFANIAVLDAGATTAHLYRASSLRGDVARRYPAVPVDDATPLGAVLSSGGEIWLPSLFDAGIRYPLLLQDAIEAELASTASLALRDQHQSLIGAMGVAWAQPQAFTDAQKNEVRVVAQLAGDALGRAQQVEAERSARQRIERLQQMMSALVASASLAEVTASVFEHGLLPFGASAARLVLVDQQQPGRLVTVNAVGLPEPLLGQWQAYPLSDASPSRRALETSSIVYVPTAADLAAEYPDAHIGQHISGQQAWVAVPLRGSGRTLGVLTLVFTRAHPLDDGPDQIALTALGATIADALGRAIQHDRDRDLVISVQRSLLADTLPERPGVRLGGYYLPAETRYGIGGDWYDAVLLPGGQMTLIVGDVVGHGLEAAVAMGQMRSAARALAPDHGPAALLEALDRFLCSTVKEPLATAAVVVIDPARRTLRYCLAGHPPPLLRGPDGTVSLLDEATGVLLGLETHNRPEAVVTFAPGSSMVLFTDGLVERRDETFDTGIARLATALKAALPPDPASLCDALVEQSAPPNDRDDDIAILSAYLA